MATWIGNYRVEPLRQPVTVMIDSGAMGANESFYAQFLLYVRDGSGKEQRLAVLESAEKAYETAALLALAQK